MTIEIKIFGENATDALTELRVLAAALVPQGRAVEVSGSAQPVAVAEVQAAEAAASTEVAAQTGAAQNSAQAGEPEKRKRRTKAEMEAAKAAEEQAAAAGDPATQAQDAADQQAEVDANRNSDAPLTREDVKKAMAKYVQAYGMPATQEDGPKIFREALGAPPEGEPYWKLSLLDEGDQVKLAKVIDIWEKATSLNPIKRAKVS